MVMMLCYTLFHVKLVWRLSGFAFLCACFGGRTFYFEEEKMGVFFYDRDSYMGYYMSDKEFKDACGVLGVGVGLLALYGVVCVALTAVLIAPFLTLAFLDNFVEGFIANNALVFLIAGVSVIILKCIRRTSNLCIIRAIFDIYIILSVLYILLYVLHFDTPIYSWFKIVDNYLPSNADRTLIEVWGTENLSNKTDGSLFYTFFDTTVGKIIDFIKILIYRIMEIDSSPLTAAMSKVNIIEASKVIGLYIALGGFAIIVALVSGVVLIAVSIISVALPYVIAGLTVVLLNKFIYKLRTHQIKAIKTPDDYEKSIRINADDIKLAENYSSEKAAEIYKKAAKAGNPLAQTLYAWELISGNNVLLDEEEGVKWYHKAALQNVAEAQYMLAVAYFEGIGTKKDKAMAKAWLMKTLENKDFKEKFSQSEAVRHATATIMKKTKYADCF